MDKSAVMTIIDRFRDAVEKQGIKVERLILYGYYAYSTPHEGCMTEFRLPISDEPIDLR